jgi:CheY-like chemotaxis protein
MKDILLVDDDVNLLAGTRRSLHGLYQLHTASSGPEGLEVLRKIPEIAVIVSDMRMPGMDGIAFLAAAKVEAPNAVRVMLTGNADQATAVDAINEGSVYRFVCKPCTKEGLCRAIDAAIRQHQLVVAEQEILAKTLGGSIQALTEILSMFDERSFGRCTRLRNLVRQCARLVDPGRLWALETAAMLAPIGSVAIPPVVMTRARQGAALTPAERRMLDRIPEVGFQLLNNIPRLEPVATLVRKLGRPVASDPCVGSRLLHILHDALTLCVDDRSLPAALREIAKQPERYDTRLLGEVAQLLLASDAGADTGSEDLTEALPLSALREGHVTAKAILAKEGTVLVSAGQVLSSTTLERLRNFAATQGLAESIVVQKRPGKVVAVSSR